MVSYLTDPADQSVPHEIPMKALTEREDKSLCKHTRALKGEKNRQTKMPQDFQPFRVSAPAKLILFGEHAVVYGKSALAGSLNLRTSVTVQPLSPSETTTSTTLIHLVRPDLKDEVHWSLEELTGLYNQGFSTQRSALTPTSCPHDLQQLLFSFCGNARDKGAVACIYLYLSILGQQWLPLSLRVESEVPVGAGLGSSAAYCVSLAGCLLALNPESNELLRPKGGSPTAAGLDLVNRWALQAERIMHGDGASGIDNTVSTYGGALLYTKGSTPIQLQRMPALNTLIINTRVSRDTKALVEGVRNRRSQLLNVMDPCMDAIHHISLEAKRLLEEVTDVELLEKNLEKLIEMNHDLLCCIGVGHPALDKVVRVTAKFGIKTKLTGAGGGGCAFSLVPKGKESTETDSAVNQVITKLERNGYQCLPSLLGGPGLSYH